MSLLQGRGLLLKVIMRRQHSQRGCDARLVAQLEGGVGGVHVRIACLSVVDVRVQRSNSLAYRIAHTVCLTDVCAVQRVWCQQRDRLRSRPAAAT